MNDKPSILETVDTFMGYLPQGKDRAILVYRRRHGGREYVRLRVWHRHRRLGKWYPDRYRKFIVPLDDAVPLARTIIQAAQGQAAEMPDWLAERERKRDEQVRKLEALNAPQEVIDQTSQPCV